MRILALKILVFAVFFFLLLAVAFSVQGIGKRETKMDDYFIENSQIETGSNNAVTAVVFDYRGFDTLIEASVLFTAATGVFLAIGRKLG